MSRSTTGKPIGPHNIATKIINALPAPEQKAPPTVTLIRNQAKHKRPAIRAKMARMARTAVKGKRRRLRHAYLRKHQKARNLVDNVHRQVIAWLTQSYTVILLPKFETSHMVKRRGRRLN